MTQEIPINPNVLRWGRESASLAVEDVVTRLGRKSITVDTITAWEAGNGSPTYPQLETLAHEIYKRPVAVFFFPDIPDEETPKTAFRTLPEVLIDKLPPTIIKLYRKAKLHQIYLDELYEGAKPVDVSLIDCFTIRDMTSITAVTQAVRKMLDVPIEEQAKWHSLDTAFKKWRASLMAHGIFVFKEAFRNDDYSGFCLYSKKYPVIFINNSMPESRQIFTLFHELGHLLYHAGGVDFRSQEVVRSLQGDFLEFEVGANRFASEFLVPADAFSSVVALQNANRESVEITEKHIEKLAEYFSVSREVILRKYLNLGLIDEHIYQQMTVKWAELAKRNKGVKSGGNYYKTLRVYLGDKYIELVFKQFYRDKISIDSASEYLSIKAKHFPNFENEVLEGGRS